MNLSAVSVSADGVFRWFHVRAIPEREAEGPHRALVLLAIRKLTSANRQKTGCSCSSMSQSSRLKFADRRSPSRQFGERPAGDAM